MTKKKWDILLHILIILTTFWAVVMYFIGEPDILGSHDVQCFKYFTTDSNILAALGSVVYLWALARKDRDAKVPQWVTVFKFVGTVAASITLLTVCFFLVPMAVIRSGRFTSVPLFFKGNVFVLHFSTPVLAIIASLFLEKEEKVTKKEAALGVVPPILYGLVYLLMVVVLKVWTDWYGFTFGGKLWLVPLVMAVMFLFSYGLSMAQRAIKNS